MISTPLINTQKIKLYFHLLFNVLTLSFWIIMDSQSITNAQSLIRVILYASVFSAVVYINIFLLFNRYFVKRRFVQYFISTFLIFLAGIFVQHLIYFTSLDDFRQNYGKSMFLFSIEILVKLLTFVLFTSLGLSYKLIEVWLITQNKNILLESENAKAELNNLKQQINPHFLFNTLNNIHILTKKNPDQASDMILGLSDLMRYQLNESAKDKVPVIREIEHITNFLDLETIRKDKVSVNLDYNREALTNLFIQPMIFMTIVENAVKHGIQKCDNGFVNIYVEVVGANLTFKVSNSKPAEQRYSLRERSGTGLNNLQKRLAIAYPRRHEVIIDNKPTEFTVTLKLDLL